ncbi:GGDEF domain-containing phosphodiesterase [Mesobacillus maritimus]|uniref:GGDEF domain-containing phosphodiesterase n=1 Tax=Mesobacillus maritimus TaxID=1643336 RepID=UPI00203BDBE3|nr:GGDEF domain-containing phosphodiesterase [Mesobacillus maritimus]MCM3587013.1 GGDEF domain-containing phosphodiesterase [Mesobacillus maritimus]
MLLHETDRESNSFENRMEMTLAFSKRYKMSIAICYLRMVYPVDISSDREFNYLESLNNTIKSRMERTIRDIDTVTKVNDTDFIIVIADVNENDAMDIIYRLLDSVTSPITLEKSQYSLQANIGVCFYPSGTKNESELLSLAKMEMYHAQITDQAISIFKGELDEAAKRKVIIENDLRYALKNNELQTVFQPQYDIKNKRVWGLEALIRWNHPLIGEIMPSEFLPLAENEGLSIELYYWILEDVCRKKGALDDNHLKVGINLSVNQLISDEFELKTMEIINKYDIQPDQIVIEITEDIQIYTVKKAVQRIKSLKSKGFMIALDDFGNGYFSFADFVNLPLDVIKLDKGFVLTLIENNKLRAVISPIIEIAHNLNFMVLIEGLEEQVQLNEWKSLGTDLAQGYLISRPMSLTDFLPNKIEIESRLE